MQLPAFGNIFLSITLWHNSFNSAGKIWHDLFIGHCMNILTEVFGNGSDLSVWQMSARGIVIFIIALILIRISGRRSFGVRTAFDNIIVILLGAVLSRAVVGASPFAAVVITCLVITLIHRIFGWLSINSPAFSRLVQGKKILLYDNGTFLEKNLKKTMVTKEDVMQGVRKSALTDNLEKIAQIWMERNGEISAVKKNEE